MCNYHTKFQLNAIRLEDLFVCFIFKRRTVLKPERMFRNGHSAYIVLRMNLRNLELI